MADEQVQYTGREMDYCGERTGTVNRERNGLLWRTDRYSEQREKWITMVDGQVQYTGREMDYCGGFKGTIVCGCYKGSEDHSLITITNLLRL